MLTEYLPILVFMVIAGVIALAMVGGSLIAARQKPYAEKLSAYECGFEAFDDARRRFDPCRRGVTGAAPLRPGAPFQRLHSRSPRRPHWCPISAGRGRGRGGTGP